MNDVSLTNGVSNEAYEFTPEDPVEKLNNLENGKTQENKTSEDRGQWGNGIEFLMSCIAMSVGLGNIWRFPFTAYENGGGAFLIPYLIILTLIGRPMYYMEMALGQFTSRGSIKTYEMLSPVFKAIGYGQIISVTCVCTYYCCLMAITILYLLNSFTSDLPWTTCLDSWSPYLQEINKTCVDSKDKLSTLTGDSISSSEMWFKKEVLHQYDNISNGLGTPHWKLTLCLFGSWVCTFLLLVRGVQSSGKASYFLALFPYVIMITLLIRAVTLDGAMNGMYYFIRTDWSKLLKAEVWYAAVTQCFFSLNVGFGSIIMYSSYNSFNHNVYRDALVVTTLDTFTSLLSGATIFGILGNLAHELGVEPDQVINSGGTGLAFISYPEAIAKFQAVPWLFAILFFLMLFVLALGSMVALVGTINTAIKDSYPNLAIWKIAAGTCSSCFLIGLVYVTPGGQYVLEMIDHFGGTFVVFFFSIFETVAICWIYGIENLCLDIEFMLKRKVGIYWRLSWSIVMPCLLLIIFVYFVLTLEPLKYGMYGLYLPTEVLVFGWLVFGISVLQALIWVMHYYFEHRNCSEGMFWKNYFTHKNWRPKNNADAEALRKFKEEIFSQRVNETWRQKLKGDLLGR